MLCPATDIWATSWQNKPKWHVHPGKTQISLGISPVWSESSLSAWRNLGSLATHWVHSEDSDQTGWTPRLIWVFAGCTFILLVLSCGGSFVDVFIFPKYLFKITIYCNPTLHIFMGIYFLHFADGMSICSDKFRISLSSLLLQLDMSLVMRKPVLAICENNKGADQPAHPRSLISTFVVRCLDSIIPLLAISKISSLYLASETEQAGFSLPWSKTLKTGFLVTRLIQWTYQIFAAINFRETVCLEKSVKINRSRN